MQMESFKEAVLLNTDFSFTTFNRSTTNNSIKTLNIIDRIAQ